MRAILLIDAWTSTTPIAFVDAADWHNLVGRISALCMPPWPWACASWVLRPAFLLRRYIGAHFFLQADFLSLTSICRGHFVIKHEDQIRINRMAFEASCLVAAPAFCIPPVAIGNCSFLFLFVKNPMQWRSCVAMWKDERHSDHMVCRAEAITMRDVLRAHHRILRK